MKKSIKLTKSTNLFERPPRKKLLGINFSEFDLNCIKVICDYLFLDRFSDSASFVRFEQCFGLLFSPKNKDFKLVEAFKEIVGPKKKIFKFQTYDKSLY